MEFKEKIKLIRKTEGYTQIKFAELLDVGYSTYQKYENGIYEGGQKTLQKLAKLHPEYSLWLLTDEVDLPNQTAPHIKSNDELEKMA